MGVGKEVLPLNNLVNCFPSCFLNPYELSESKSQAFLWPYSDAPVFRTAQLHVSLPLQVAL